MKFEWNNIEVLVGNMRDDCRATENLMQFKYDAVVSISRGGCIPGTMLAYLLDLPMFVAGVNMYTADDKPTDDVVVRQKLYLPEDVESIIIVDDISDRGDTLNYTWNCYNDNCKWIKNISTATLCTRHSSKFVPTFPGIKIDHDDWITFPWDTPKSSK